MSVDRMEQIKREAKICEEIELIFKKYNLNTFEIQNMLIKIKDTQIIYDFCGAIEKAGVCERDRLMEILTNYANEEIEKREKDNRKIK